jgi:Phage tail sheath C-terminal domain/Phage tail sheath protein subtilisin-like domain/Protein of unknown function (DUF2586)
MVETILPGTYVTVRDEGLIGAGSIASGNMGIVGTAAKGPVDEVKVISSFSEAKEIFGEADTWGGGNKNELTLIRALELVYNNGGQTVYAVRTAGKKTDDIEALPGKEEYQKSLALLENEIINIVLVAGQDNSVAWLQEMIEGHLKITAGTKRERIAIVGSAFTDGKDNLDAIANHTFNNERLIFTAPGILVAGKNKIDQLPGGYLAAAVAGLIASLPVQASPTNKTLSLSGLSTVFNAAQLENLVTKRVLAVEKRDGFRIVKGITTNDGAWRQITTRRIVDYAIYGVRSACNPYIGKLNNDRVRGAMKATLDAFLTRMVNDEALVGYELSVSATRSQEIAGEAIVTLTLKPTFSIDFIKVTMYLG